MIKILKGVIAPPFWFWTPILVIHIVQSIRLDIGWLGILAGLHIVLFLKGAYEVGIGKSIKRYREYEEAW